MVVLTRLAPEKAELLNSPRATRTVGGSSRWVKETKRSCWFVSFDVVLWSVIMLLKEALTHGKPIAPDAGFP